MATTEDVKVLDSVKDYYGKRVKKTEDLQTQACVAPGKKVTKPIREAIGLVHDVVASKYYGCGMVIPAKLEGMKVLDLGSGSGRDCFAISKLVGADGFVTGVDMTDEQLAVAREYIPYHMEKFGYTKPNVEFVKGYIERLEEAGCKDNTYDIIVSNCVVNLSPDKKAVLQSAYNVLKEGGELYFSDVYADKQVDEAARKHEVLWGECISGALFWKDLHSLAREIGFSKPFMVSATPIPIDREDFKQILGDTKFASVTYRLVKLPADAKSSSPCQVIYNGEITAYEDKWDFDVNNSFKANDIVTVDGSVCTVLKASRFSDEFDFQPLTKQTCGSGDTTCCSSESEDPFAYLEEKMKSGKKIDPACCSPGSCCS